MPRSIVIAVSGHRRIQASRALTDLIRQGCEHLREYFSNSVFDIATCLAEGADQILTVEIGQELRASYTVFLPLPKEDYIQDFHSPSLVADFTALLASARCVNHPPSSSARPTAYAEANSKMLATADVLFAIWDGEPSRGIGGTAAVVANARLLGMPIVWIRFSRSDEFSITYEHFSPNILKGG